ncbi:MAG: SDR family oxidoreductase [Pseudomonadales bacterium]
MRKRAIIIGISSGIGEAIAKALLAQGYEVMGSYRAEKNISEQMKSISLPLDTISCDDIQCFVDCVKEKNFAWDYLILCSGTMEPIGAFEKIDIDKWAGSFNVNLIGLMRLLHGLLPLRNKQKICKSSVLSLAGGGVNGAPVNYSAYTLAKIGLIKMTELLAAEIPDVNFINMGPGWVDTLIHQETIKAAENAGQAYAETQRRLLEKEFVPMDKVVESALTLLGGDADIYSGRNFSVASDQLDSGALQEALREDPEMYKLRRHKNEWQ